jgi:hypothetical protein
MASRIATFTLIAMALMTGLIDLQAVPRKKAALGIDVDFYTGPISRDVWLRMKKAGLKFVVAQAWGGRSRNEFAASQLAGARSIGGMKEAAYVLLNYDDRVCPTFAQPVRDRRGKCAGDLISQETPGARWQVRQGLAALGAELPRAAFVAIDVEWFLSGLPPSDSAAVARRRQYILDAIDEVRARRKRAVVYTRNVDGHWLQITGCRPGSSQPPPGCETLSSVIGDPANPVPLWDVQGGDADLSSFKPYGEWMERLGRQYKLDRNLFGLPAARTVDLDVFDISLFSPVRPGR